MKMYSHANKFRPAKSFILPTSPISTRPTPSCVPLFSFWFVLSRNSNYSTSKAFPYSRNSIALLVCAEKWLQLLVQEAISKSRRGAWQRQALSCIALFQQVRGAKSSTRSRGLMRIWRFKILTVIYLNDPITDLWLILFSLEGLRSRHKVSLKTMSSIFFELCHSYN